MPRLRRRLQLVSLALVALLVLAACGGGGGTEEEPAEQGAQNEALPAKGELTAAGLRTSLNNELREHVFLVAAATGAALQGNDQEFLAATTAEKEISSVEIAGLVASVYGRQMRDTFLDLWNSHIDTVVAYTQALASGDELKAEQAAKELTGYAETLAGTFDRVTEGGLPADTSQPLILEHIITLKSVIDKQHASDYAGAYADLRTAMSHVDRFAKPLTAAIAEQKDIPGEVDSQAADLQVGLNGLLQEHVYLAGAATGAALQGQTEEFAAASAAETEGNSVALADAIGALYGHQTREAFLGLWNSHIDMLVDYTQGIGADDQAKADAAVQDLIGYVDTLAVTLEQITGLPVNASTVLIEEHVTSLKGTVDLQKAGDLTGAYTQLHETANHMRDVADSLATQIAAQQSLS